MKHDALHKRRSGAAAKQLTPTPPKSLECQRASHAAEAFFALWQDALRDAAKLQEIMPRVPVERAEEDV